MTSHSNVERATALFEKRDRLVQDAKLVLDGTSHRLSSLKPERTSGSGAYYPEPFPRAGVAVLHLGAEFKTLVEAEVRAQVDEISRELRSLGIQDDFSLDDTLTDA